MDVMDLSLPKSHHMTASASTSCPVQNYPPYTYCAPAVLPPPAHASATQRALFQQMRFAAMSQIELLQNKPEVTQVPAEPLHHSIQPIFQADRVQSQGPVLRPQESASMNSPRYHQAPGLFQPHSDSFQSAKRRKTSVLPQNSIPMLSPLSDQSSVEHPELLPQPPIGHLGLFHQQPAPFQSDGIHPSTNHLGLFEQIQYAATPQNDVFKREKGVEVPLSPHKPISMHSPGAPTLPNEKEDLSGPRAQFNRPFKTVSATKTNSMSFVSALDPEFEAEFEKYRKRVLASMSQPSSGTNKNMRRYNNSNPEKCANPEYLEKRRKNNEAAKKSREARKEKEDELAIRVGFLESETLKMKFQLAAVEKEKKMLMMRNRMKSMQYVYCTN